MAVAKKTKKVDQKQVNDGWENVVTGLGRSRDKREGGRQKIVQSNSSHRKFDDLFAGDDVAAVIAELPAKEMLREWISVFTDATDGGEGVGDRLASSKAVMQSLESLGAQAALFEAKLWSRVHGGALIFLGVNDGQEVDLPLVDDRVRTFDFLTVFDRWDLRIAELYSDVTEAKFGKPKLYEILPRGRMAGQGKLVHETRMIRFDGVKTSRRRMEENAGWSDSIFTRLEELIRDYQVAWGSVFHLLADFENMVYKIKGLAQMLASDGEGLVLDRLISMDTCKGVVRGIPLDADMEDATRMGAQISGLPEMMQQASLRLAQAARMPVTLLMGQSPAGMNATGASDIQLFYDQIRAMQKAELADPINRILTLLFASQNGPTKGVTPDNWSFEFNALWQLDDKQEAETRKLQAETDAIYIDAGVLFDREVTQSRFGGDKYSADTVLDEELRAIETEIGQLRKDPTTSNPFDDAS